MSCMDLSRLALAVGATARLTRFVTTDKLGEWWIKDPVDRAMDRYAAEERRVYGADAAEPWWWRYRVGLDCPYCVGFWIGAAVLASEAVTRRPRAARTAWVFGAGALALNYVTAHAGAALGDFDTDDDEHGEVAE